MSVSQSARPILPSKLAYFELTLRIIDIPLNGAYLASLIISNTSFLGPYQQIAGGLYIGIALSIALAIEGIFTIYGWSVFPLGLGGVGFVEFLILCFIGIGWGITWMFSTYHLADMHTDEYAALTKGRTWWRDEVSTYVLTFSILALHGALLLAACILACINCGRRRAVERERLAISLRELEERRTRGECDRRTAQDSDGSYFYK